MFLQNLKARTGLFGWLIAALAFTSIPNSYAAPVVLFNTPTGAACSTPYSTGAIHANRYVVRNALTISYIDVLIGSGSQTNFSSARYFIMSDDAANNRPLAPLETFTPDAITGSGGSDTVARFIGSITLSAGTKIWIVGAQNAAVFPQCYINGYSATSFTFNGITVDTSTSGSNGLYRRAYVSPGTTPLTTAWNGIVEDAIAWQLSIGGTKIIPYIGATLGTQNGAPIANYRLTSTLVANVDQPAKVTFYANSKVISGCRNILSSAGISTCSWRPTVHGSNRVYAIAVPVNTAFTATTTSTISIGVVSRTNTR